MSERGTRRDPWLPLPTREPDLLERLYEEHADALYGLAYVLTESAADARDVLQEVFIALPEALTTYEGRAPIGYWLRRVTTRVALTRLRWRRSRREVGLGALGPVVSRDDPAAVLDRLSVEHLLSELSESQRIVLVLKEFEGLRHEEIAELLGITNAASRARLARAMKRLRRLARR